MFPNNNYAQNPQMYAYTYPNTAPRMAKNTQPLTNEQIEMFRSKGNEFSMKVPPEELVRSACTHKEKNGATALVVDESTGEVTCTICKKKFRIRDESTEEVREVVNHMKDLLETSKALYLDAPDELILKYYQMIPLLDNFPALWERATSNFNMYDKSANQGAPMQMGPYYNNGFGTLSSLIAGGGYYNPMYGGYNPNMAQPQQMGYGQPMYPNMGQPQQMPYGQPMYNQGYNPNMYQPQQMPYPQDATNPMAYGAPAQQPQAAPSVGTVPAAQPQPAPAASANQQDVVQQKTWDV